MRQAFELKRIDENLNDFRYESNFRVKALMHSRRKQYPHRSRKSTAAAAAHQRNGSPQSDGQDKELLKFPTVIRPISGRFYTNCSAIVRAAIFRAFSESL
jgi:hypothetical protein